VRAEGKLLVRGENGKAFCGGDVKIWFPSDKARGCQDNMCRGKEQSDDAIENRDRVGGVAGRGKNFEGAATELDFVAFVKREIFQGLVL
jgi:hypothetical protein